MCAWSPFHHEACKSGCRSVSAGPCGLCVAGAGWQALAHLACGACRTHRAIASWQSLGSRKIERARDRGVHPSHPRRSSSTCIQCCCGARLLHRPRGTCSARVQLGEWSVENPGATQASVTRLQKGICGGLDRPETPWAHAEQMPQPSRGSALCVWRRSKNQVPAYHRHNMAAAGRFRQALRPNLEAAGNAHNKSPPVLVPGVFCLYESINPPPDFFDQARRLLSYTI